MFSFCGTINDFDFTLMFDILNYLSIKVGIICNIYAGVKYQVQKIDFDFWCNS